MGFIVVKHCNLTKCVSKKIFCYHKLVAIFFHYITSPLHYHSITSLDNRQYSKSVRSVLKGYLRYKTILCHKIGLDV